MITIDEFESFGDLCKYSDAGAVTIRGQIVARLTALPRSIPPVLC